MHSSGESITGILPVLVGEKATSQQLGSAITYNRRYALAAIAGVAPEDDDGNKASETSGKTTFAKPSMTDDLKTRATELVRKIELCESKEELKSVVEKNAGLISTIATASSEWHKRLLERIEEQRDALSPPA